MALFNTLGTSPAGFISGGAIGIFRAVVLDSVQGQVVASSAITQSPVGIAMQSAAGAGETIPVQTFGDAKCVASDAIAIGAQVMCTATGAGKVVTAAGATARSIGIALEAAGADNDIITVRLNLPATLGPANT